jgi:predicted esterase
MTLVLSGGGKGDRRTAVTLGVTLALLIVALAVTYAVMRSLCMKYWNRAVLALQVSSRAPESLQPEKLQARVMGDTAKSQAPSASTARAVGSQIMNLFNAEKKGTPFVPPTDQTVLLSGKNDKKLQNLGMVFSEGDTVFVVYRGTITRVEWNFDMKFNQTDKGVHEGFSRVYDEVRDAMLDAVKARAPQRIVVGGHSLGGALSLLTALELSTLYPGAVSVYAFAVPRVGTQAVADALMLGVPELFLFTNDADMVPLVPLSVQPSLSQPHQPWYYAHLPQMHFHDNRGSWSANHSMEVYMAHLP